MADRRQLDPGMPADMKVLETLINEMQGHKRVYVSQKIKHYQSQLRNDNDVVLMQALTELNSDLTMTSEDQWIGQPLHLLIPDIMNCLDMEFLPEVMSTQPIDLVMASTVLNNILEVCPEACATIVEGQHLEKLGLKLLNNDLTENVINSLEKISQEYSNTILSTGVLEMLMNVVDFLVVQSQVSILKIVSRVCKTFSDKENDLEGFIMPVLPIVNNIMENSSKTEETAVETYLNLTRRVFKLYEHDRNTMEEKMNTLAKNNGTVELLMRVAEKHAIHTADAKSHSILLNLFSIFQKFAYMSADLSQELLVNRVDVLILRTLENEDGQGEDSKIVMNEIISFINTLLSLNNYQNDFFHRIFGLAGIEIIKHHNSERKVKFIEDNQELVKDMLIKIVKDCSGIFEASEDFFFKYLFLTAQRKIVMFLDDKTLKQCVDRGIYSNFISKTLDSNDIIVTIISLFIIQSVATKMPEIKQDLSRHGIVSFLKKLSDGEGLNNYVVPEVNKKAAQPNLFASGFPGGILPSSLSKRLLSSNSTKDREDFMQQLMAWQKNPKMFLDNLTKFKDGDRNEIREGGENPEGEEEHQHNDEDDDNSNPENPRRKSTQDIEEMEVMDQEDINQHGAKLSDVTETELGESIVEEAGLRSSEMKEETPNELENSLRESSSMMEETLGTNFSGEPPSLKPSKSNFTTPPSQPTLSSKKTSSNQPIQPFQHGKKPSQPTSAAKEKIPEYTIQQAREDLRKLAKETLDMIGSEVAVQSEEMVLLANIRKTFESKSLSGLTDLSEFFKSNRNVTFYEFTQANFIKPMMHMFINESNTTEDVARFLKTYYESFYQGERFASIESFYSNLLSFIARLPEIMPFVTNDQLARSSFVQELKFLSTPLKIKVNFNQALSNGVSREEFLDFLVHELPATDYATREGLLHDSLSILKLFKEVLLKQNTIWLQVERFASLKSVEVYLIDKFSTKNLVMTSEEFSKKRAKDGDDLSPVKKGGVLGDYGDSETILTPNYLEKRIEEQLNFGKEKDIRRYFEKQYIRKPSKLIAIKFELRIPLENGDFTRKTISSQTTIHELVSILSKEQSKKALGTIELDYSIEIKNDIFSRVHRLDKLTPEHKSGLSVLYHDIKEDITAVNKELDGLDAGEELKQVILALKLIQELDNLKTEYLDGPSSKIHQHVKLDGDYHSSLGAKLADHKLSAVYTKLFTKPSKILGQTFPMLCKVMCSRLPELFDFNTRYYFFKHLKFEPTRAMYFIYQSNKPAFKEIPGSKIGKLKRRKMIVNRDQVLEGARLAFSVSDFQSNVLEFAFEHEEGSGLGPTLEFYSLLAEDFKMRGKQMWRDTDDFSYFPRPCDPKLLDAKTLAEETNLWRILGAICGRSALDERIFDMRFSEAFWKVVLGKRVGLSDIGKLSGGLMKTLSDMQALVNKYQSVINEHVESPSEIDRIKSELTYNGVGIEDLCLSFTLPGYEDFDLIPGGSKKDVNLDNLELYVDLVIRTYLIDSIMPYVEAFRQGLNMFITLEKLNCFLPSELEMVFCGNKTESWTMDYLKENISPMHGYSMKSTSFVNFLEVILEFSEEQKREFLMFTIGAPRLPLGGLKNLSPRLTVVKKMPHNDKQSADTILPSVMTCQNYIKLPDYSSKDVLRKKLLIAMKEGQKSFTLS